MLDTSAQVLSTSRRPRLQRSLLSLSVASTLLISLGAYATESAVIEEGQAQEKSSPKSEAVTLDEVTVTAQRRVQRARDVPLTVAALSEQTLKEAGVISIFDLPSAVSGLSFGGAGNLVQPSIRGVSATVSVGGAENSNALYVDGVFYSQAHLFGANLPDIERVEVLKGPQGTLFGRNSVGGAVRIFTRAPNLERAEGDFSLDYGYFTGGNGSRSAPHHVAKAFFTAPLVNERLAFSVSAAHDYSPGWITDDRTGGRTAPHERVNARAKLLFKPNENFSALFNAYYLKHDDRGVQAMTPLNGMVSSSYYPGSVVSSIPYHYSFDTSGDRNWDTANVENSGVSLTMEWNTEAGLLTSMTNKSKDDIYNLTTIHQGWGTLQCLQSFMCMHMDRGSTNAAFSQELNFSSNEFGKFSFITGVFYYDSDATGVNYLNGGVNPTNPQGTLSYLQEFNLTSIAGYGEAQLKATDRFTATIGGRYTREKRKDFLLQPTYVEREKTFTSFLPKLSLMYALNDNANVYFTYSVGQASGLTGISNSASVPRYQPIDPEKNSAYEIGYKYSTRKASLNAAAFYYDYKDKQEQVGVANSAGGTFHLNTGPVRIYGLDLDGSYHLNDSLTLRANLSWVPEAKYLDFPVAVGITTDRRPNGQFQQIFFDATGNRLMRAPKLTSNITLAYDRTVSNGRLDASATLYHSSKVFHDTFHVIEEDGYTTLSARLGYTFANNMRVGLYGKNLTNELYIHHGFGSAYGFTVNYAMPREVGLSLGYSF